MPITIFTDGCSFNEDPRIGGFAAIILYDNQRDQPVVLKKAFLWTNSGRMELLAVARSLEFLKKPSIVRLYTDAKNIADNMALDKLERWRSNNWINRSNKFVRNKDLWQKIYEMFLFHEEIITTWIRGHDGIDYNELVNDYARKESMSFYQNYMKLCAK